MSLEFHCDRCRELLEEPGALLFSPPGTTMGFGLVEKLHLCKKCWYIIRAQVLGVVIASE